ncbi:hypothetical protein LPB140_07005 [Sphingorhabdus lutea]|uniref:DUF11 domain-containing protein n=1 Tax=Sphingorhabdus lutea TaxID=1913578 RepID=A0A1L3JBR1_9SPHN|nr:hypothetical protein [Sphingorhabdus lutea]APG62574.1 hypothetical protein LPB140_07005 [Sphingorhabdus lutea]
MISKIKYILASAAVFAAMTSAHAASVELNSKIFVEKTTYLPNGTKRTTLEAPKTILPGDNLVFVVNYKNIEAKAANNIIITNPLPNAVNFVETHDGTEIVSVDGGRMWGKLSSLTVRKPDGTYRPALAGDVTHLRWKLNKSIGAGAGGKLIFRGSVK